MNGYEVTDLFEIGEAGDMIQAKTDIFNDELGGPVGPLAGGFEEE